MRLIDADVVKKPIYAEADNIKGMDMTFDEIDGYNNGIDEIFREIENAPTIDAVEVVRCKDCLMTEERDKYKNKVWCFWHREYMDDMYYCADGLRRENGEA